MVCGSTHSLSSSPPHRTGRADFPQPALGGCSPVCFICITVWCSWGIDSGRIAHAGVRSDTTARNAPGSWRVSSTAISGLDDTPASASFTTGALSHPLSSFRILPSLTRSFTSRINSMCGSVSKWPLAASASRPHSGHRFRS